MMFFRTGSFYFMFNIDSEVNSNSLLNSFLTKNQMKIMHIVFGSDVLD